MKRFLFSQFSIVLLLYSFFFSSCNEINEVTPLNSLTVTVNKAAIYENSGESFVFQATGDDNVDYTSVAEFYVNNNLIQGCTYTATLQGTYSVYAKKDDLTSNTVIIEVLPSPTLYAHKVLIEDFTGAWCGWCPRVTYSIEQVHSRTDKVLVAAIHRGNPSGPYYDPWNLSEGVALETALNLQGYPTAFLNRVTEWTYPENANINQPINMLKQTSTYGIAISSTLGAGSGTITVSFSFKESLPNARCVVYVLEDDLRCDQVNYTSFFGGASVLVNFRHMDVVRKVVSSSILGQNIPSDQSVADNVYTMSFTASSYTSSNIDKLKVMVILLNSNGRVENVQVAPANCFQDYELAD
ncbi:MAG: Omp28-related outer membrane protein [Bacteroidales bacterium]|nr:Omp28-related outer membrane protein [Bacteroidales bacterium]MCL2133390.1 Omp28-related outer membrane protein [Bacteroidales bacterium]